MIRGISKKIIEINDTGSDLFEKAIFYVKSDKNINDRALKSEADRIICSYINDSGSNRKMGYLRSRDAKRKKIGNVLLILSLIAVIALLVFLGVVYL